MEQPNSYPGTLEIEALVKRGYETPDADYKGPGNWRSWSSAEKAELVRDMMAMGNADRPGWIILGVSHGRNGQWAYNGLPAEQAGSFDPTDIGNKVKRHVDSDVRFSVHQAEVDGKIYVAIRTEPFSTIPHICTRSSGDVLEEAAIYVRTAACQTAKVTRAEDMRRLVERATQVHADSIVRQTAELIERAFQVHADSLGARLADLLGQVEREAAPMAAEAQFAEQIEEARRRQ